MPRNLKPCPNTSLKCSRHHPACYKYQPVSNKTRPANYTQTIANDSHFGAIGFFMFCFARYSRFFLHGLLLIGGLQTLNAQAAPEHSLSGFATLGLVSNSNDTLVFRRDVSQDDGSYNGAIEWQTDSLIGAQWQARWNHQWHTKVQLVAKERFNSGLEETVEWAFVGYHPREGLDVRLGRLGADFFTLSDYRQVGYAYPWARPPQDFYGLLSIFHLDGADITQGFSWGETDLSIKGFYGKHDEKFPVGLRSSGHSRLNFDTGGLSFTAERGFWKWRYTYADVKVKNNATETLVSALTTAAPYWPEASKLAELSQTHGRRFSYHSLGAIYDNNHWWLRGEFSHLESDIGLVPQSERAYLSIGKQFDRITLYALGGYSKPRRDLIQVQAPEGLPSPLAEQLAQLALVTRTNLNGVRIDQSSLGAGVRWDFATKMALKLQVEEFHISAKGTNLWLRVDSSQPVQKNQHSTVTSLTWDMLF